MDGEHDEKNGTINENKTENEKDINELLLKDNGSLITDKATAAVIPGNARVFIVAGWVFAALAAFIWPYIAVLGVASGFAANIKQRRAGNALIITNIVFAAVNLLFRYFVLRMA